MTPRETCFLCFVQHGAAGFENDYFGLSKRKPREKSRGLKRAWDTCGKISVRKWQLLYCLFYVVHKQPILQFFKTRTVKKLHGTTNRFTSKMELGDDHWQFSFKTTTYS